MKIEKANRAITRAWIATLILAILGLIATSRSQVEALFEIKGSSFLTYIIEENPPYPRQAGV